MGEAQKADQEAALEVGSAPSTYSSETVAEEVEEEEPGGGSLATDEALAALREKLTGAGE
jgi:small subunit ribosomal protein S1